MTKMMMMLMTVKQLCCLFTHRTQANLRPEFHHKGKESAGI